MFLALVEDSSFYSVMLKRSLKSEILSILEYLKLLKEEVPTKLKMLNLRAELELLALKALT